MEEAEFKEHSVKIIKVLGEQAEIYGQDGLKIKHIYNQAINDAVDFVGEMAKSNPQHRMAYMSLEKEIRHWLVLR
ncbi:MAG: hypothetical protein FVQ79_04180 [Planctomycetes bacterium]|nr:hypothetical protein [Planctomycetota bacterium]